MTHGWIEHDGNGKPKSLANEIDIAVKFRNGVRSPPMASFVCHWKHSEKRHGSDIVAYRIITNPGSLSPLLIDG